MQSYHNSAVLQFDSATTGNAAVTVPVTVRINSTQALAVIYDLAEVAKANPTNTDSKGNYNFKIADGVYDMIISEGLANEVKLEKVQISEFIGLINDLSQTYIFPTVAAFKASVIEFPDGKIIHLLDRGADFTKITGTGTATGNGIIASTSVNQSIGIQEGNANAKAYGAKAGGDSTLPLQELLNSEVGDVDFESMVTYTTTTTLFNQKPHRTVKCNNALIDNNSNVRFSIVTVSEALTTQTEAALAIFMAEDHFSEPIFNAHIEKLRISGDSAASGGANLSIGVIYGKYCSIEAWVLSSNGNASQIQGSYGTTVNIRASGHRAYGIFNYQSKYTKGNVFATGGGRTLIVKHAYYDDGELNCDFNVTSINCDDRCISGGVSAGTGGSPALEPPGHEVTGNVRVRTATLTAIGAHSLRPQIILGVHAVNWVFDEVVIENGTGDPETYNVNIGLEGTPLFAVGGNHRFKSLVIRGAVTTGVPVISANVSTTFDYIEMDGSVFWGLYGGTPNAELSNPFISVGKFVYNGALVNSNSAGGLITCLTGWDVFSVGTLDGNVEATKNIAIPTRTDCRLTNLDASTGKVTGGNVKITIPVDSEVGTYYGAQFTGDFALLSNTSLDVTNLKAGATIFGVAMLGTDNIVGLNHITLTDAVASTSQGIRYTLADTSERALNIIDGDWVTQEQGV